MWQAGQRGIHFAFRAISAAAKTPLCLSGATPLRPLERARCAVARFCETLGSVTVIAGDAPFSSPPRARFCPAYDPRSACGAAARASRPPCSPRWRTAVKALAVRVSQGKRIAAPPDLAACLRQQLQKCVEAVRFLQKRRVYEAAEQLPVGWLQSCAALSVPRFSSYRRSGWNTTAQCRDRRSC